MDVSLRHVTISRDGKQGFKVRVTSRTGRARRISGISKKVRIVEASHWTRRFDFWGSLRRNAFARYRHRARWWADEKDNIERLCLSSLEESLNSKVIKGSYLNWEVVTCFSYFEILCFKFSICGYEHSMSISHIAVSWLWYILLFLLHSLIMWITVSSLSPHYLHMLFCCVLSIVQLDTLSRDGIVLRRYSSNNPLFLKTPLSVFPHQF